MSALKTQIAKLAEYDIKSHASLLKWTTLIIWACSLAAEVGTFAFNKKLPDKEKSFIIKQELTAGGISLAVMYLLADRFEKAGEWLVAHGKLLPKELPKQWRTEENLQKILNGDQAFLKKELKGDATWINKLGGFQKGVSVALGTLGTIIAFNLTTPLISNKIASYFQNKSLSAKPVSKPQVPTNPTFQPMPQTFPKYQTVVPASQGIAYPSSPFMTSNPLYR
jgi:hypothetical protein